MERHYTYLSEVIADPEWEKFVTGILICLGLVVLGFIFSKKIGGRQGLKDSVVPDERPSFVGVVDFFLEPFVKYQDGIMGVEGRKFLPFTGTLFFFLLSSNMLALIPGVAAATTTVWINVGISIAVFIYFNYLGVKANGLLGYLKHFCGPMWPIAFILFPVEIISTVLRVLTLNLRLYWNITADHLMLSTFTDLPDLMPFPPSIFVSLLSLAGVPFYALGVFVCFVQALIFTTLTMVYISLAVQHEEEH